MGPAAIFDAALKGDVALIPPRGVEFVIGNWSEYKFSSYEAQGAIPSSLRQNIWRYGLPEDHKLALPLRPIVLPARCAEELSVAGLLIRGNFCRAAGFEVLSQFRELLESRQMPYALCSPEQREAVRSRIKIVLAEVKNEGTFKVRFILDEGVKNSFQYGSKLDPRKPVDVTSCFTDNGDFVVTSRDTGTGFDETKIPDCTLDENLELVGGRGLAIMRGLLDRLEYHDGGRTMIAAFSVRKLVREKIAEAYESPADT